MGDHRASIKISMEAHGKKYEDNWWINWSPNADGCDPRIVEWFRECWDDAYRRYDAEIFEATKEQREKEEREAELEQLAKLKAKYEK